MEASNHCYDACLQEEDIKMMSQCIRLDRECADICAYLEQSLVRGTPFAAELASVCAKICEECGNEWNVKNTIMIIVKNVQMHVKALHRILTNREITKRLT